jgi:ATP-binding cassette subfamily B protein
LRNRSLSAPGGQGNFHLYSELWRLAAGSRRVLLGAATLLLLAQVVLLAVPLVAARAIDTLQAQGLDGLGKAGWLFSSSLVLALLSWMLHGPARLLERNIALRVRERLTHSLLEKLFELPLSWHQGHASGATAHRVQQSTKALATFAENQYIYIGSAVRLIGPIVALWCIEPLVGSVCILGFAVITASVLRFDRLMIRLALEENAADRQYAAGVIETLGNATTVFALRQSKLVIASLQRSLREVFKPLKRLIVVNEMKWLVVDVSTRSLSILLVVVFAWTQLRSASHSGQTHSALMLGSLYLVWEYATQASGVVVSIAQHFQSFARQKADYQSCQLIMDADPESQPNASGSARARSWSTLSIQGLTFAHAGSQRDVPSLDDVCLRLRRGRRYAVIGGSGSGKSTLLRVIAGLHRAEKVSLQFDSLTPITGPIQAAHALRAMSTLIPQEAELFQGSVADNITMCERVDGAPHSMALSHVLRVAHAEFACCDEVVRAANVSERASNWSGGQRGRLALARGVLAAYGSSLVLLDEPTAHLDPATEVEVYSRLFGEFADSCLITSIHRLHLLDKFDEIIVMDAGRIVTQGPLDAVLLGYPDLMRAAA